MGGRSGMGEVSRAPNAPAIEERGRKLYSLVPYLTVAATNIVALQ